jgi:glutamyl-tRNA reductase
MKLIAFGLNHKTSPLVLREQFALSHEKQKIFLKVLTERLGCQEAVFLVTCNRCELYVLTENITALVDYLCTSHQLSKEDFLEYTYLYEDHAAMMHAMRVASGMDSMVFGEPQIFGQLKTSLEIAQEVGTLGSYLQYIFNDVFSTVKKIRTQTSIGSETLSLGALVTNLAKMIYEDFTTLHVLLIGAGETIELVAKHFAHLGVKHLTAVNRSIENAEAILTPYGGRAYGLEHLEQLLPTMDVIVSATSANSYVLTKDHLLNCAKMRQQRPKYCIDLAVPRDIDPKIAEFDNVYLYNIDDLNHIIHHNLNKRKAAIDEANHMIQKAAYTCLDKLAIKHHHHFIHHYRHNANKIKEQELLNAMNLLQSGVAAEEVVSQLAHALTGKLTHEPTLWIKKIITQFITKTPVDLS